MVEHEHSAPTADRKTELRAKYRRMRESGANRAELSAQACADLFELGDMPTAKSVRDVTEIGSLTDVARDVSAFWQGVRRTMMRRMKAELPESVLDLAGKLAVEIFDHALAEADTRFDAARGDLQAQVDNAATRAVAEQAERERAEEATLAVRAELTDVRGQLEQASSRLVQAEAQKSAVEANLGQMRALNGGQARRITELESTVDQQGRAAEKAAGEFAERLKQADEEAQRRIKPLLVELDTFRTREREWKDQRAETARREFTHMEHLARITGERDSLASTNDRLLAEVRELSHALATAQIEARSAGLSDEAKAAIARAYLATRDDGLRSILGDDYRPSLAGLECPACGKEQIAFEQIGETFAAHCEACEWEGDTAPTRIDAIAGLPTKSHRELPVVGTDAGKRKR